MMQKYIKKTAQINKRGAGKFQHLFIFTNVNHYGSNVHFRFI